VVSGRGGDTGTNRIRETFTCESDLTRAGTSASVSAARRMVSLSDRASSAGYRAHQAAPPGTL
jgi:hypothetical protein